MSYFCSRCGFQHNTSACLQQAGGLHQCSVCGQQVGAQGHACGGTPTFVPTQIAGTPAPGSITADLFAAQEEVRRLHLQNGELKTQLRTAQEVINKHVADQVEGLHCVDCTAEEDEICDCPMLAPIFAAMKGYELPTIEDLLGECRECNRLVRDCGNHGPGIEKPKGAFPVDEHACATCGGPGLRDVGHAPCHPVAEKRVEQSPKFWKVGDKVFVPGKPEPWPAVVLEVLGNDWVNVRYEEGPDLRWKSWELTERG